MSAEKVKEKPSLINPMVRGDFVELDRDECVAAGKKLHKTYVENQPFPHIVMENFLPMDLLRRVVEEFPKRETGRFADAHSNLKTGYQMEKIRSDYITNLQNALNSSQFIEFLEEMTGIKGLFADPHFAGGGLHETARGGHLSIHADFNIHPRLKVRRRMNLILFLNETWEDSYGGHLELWEKDMSKCAHKVLPLMGRAVVFNTEDDSFHGHPDPTTNPPEMFRRSIALYYYTAADGTLAETPRTTDFKARPGTADQKASTKMRVKAVAKEVLPPIISRKLFR
jgi:Rps23 Pro-64 3,4-dihydroxylase Tpa1-like proline 4-hydroxylase